jgi:uncharacterized protein DUF2730
MQQAYGPPEQPPVDPDALPARRGDLRSLRRWVVVAVLWAVAASAIALIALIAKDDQPSSDGSSGLARQVSRSQRQLDQRLDSIERQLQDLPQSEDVRRLDNRLKDVEERSSRAARDAERARVEASDLQDRVDELERSQGQAQQP